MEVGQRIKDRWGDEGRVVRKLTLDEVNAIEGSDPEQVDGDMPYLEVERSNGLKFYACEYECKVMRD